jgi:type IV secretion system protein TrbG
MPLYMRSREAPVLHVIDSAGQQQIVNYRLQDDRYIVHQVFDRAVLSSGVGWSQEKVTIYRGELDPVAAFFTRIFN